MNGELAPLTSFVLPGAAVPLRRGPWHPLPHRSAARGARDGWPLNAIESRSTPDALRYVNRPFLVRFPSFVAARFSPMIARRR